MQTYWSLIQYLPRALANVFLAPFPWDWFTPGKQTGAFRYFIFIDMILIYGLLPLMVRGVYRLWKSGDSLGLMLPAFVVSIAAPLAIAVPNVGALFRQRLTIIYFMIILAMVGGVPSFYRWMARGALRIRGGLAGRTQGV